MKFRLLLIVAVATLFFASCKNSGTTGLPIPKDALVILHINTSSITSKLSWKDIKETNWFKEASQDEKDSLTRQIMENPEASGVDIKSDFVFFVKKQGASGYMVFEGNLKDAAAFEKVLLSKHKDAKVEKDGDLSYIKGEHDQMVSWNSSKFVIMSDAPMLSMMSSYGMGSADMKTGSFTTDSLRKFTKELLALSSDNSIEKDDRFSSLLKESGDVHFWINADEYTSSMAGGMLSMLKMSSLLQGNVATFTLNFDDGKVSVKAKQFYGKEMQKMMDQYKSKNVDADLVNRIPGDVVGAMVMNIDPQFVKTMLKATGMDGMANGMLGKSGLSLDELINATKGQFVISVSDLNISKKQVIEPAYYQGGKPDTSMRTSTDMKFLFATSVNNRPTFEKLMGMARQMMKGEDSSKVNMKLTNDWFAGSNDAATADKFLAGGNNHVAFADKISGHPFGMYIDLQKVLKATMGERRNAYDSAMYDANTKMWQEVMMTGGEYKNGTATADFVLNLVDKSTNSLKQINRFAEQMHAASSTRQKDMVNTNPQVTPLTDSATVVPMVEAPKDNK